MPDPIIIGNATLINGDCLAVMPTLAADSLDAIVTDPPYGLSFMGKDWDHGIPGTAFWVEALRVAKPGAHLLAFGGSRTFHRLVCAIEDAGWEVRDVLMWVYGSGFPKSLDVSKALDKREGAEREVIGVSSITGRRLSSFAEERNDSASGFYGEAKVNHATAPATDAARQWAGWGTALKPAYEPILLARKPLAGTVAANVLAHGCGVLNIDGCRVATDGKRPHIVNDRRNGNKVYQNGLQGSRQIEPTTLGRFPANFIHDGSPEVVECFPVSNQKPAAPSTFRRTQDTTGWSGGSKAAEVAGLDRGDSGSAARYFKTCPDTDPEDFVARRLVYGAKANKRDRDEGLDNFEKRKAGHIAIRANDEGNWSAAKNPNYPRANHHPTVKSTSLMTYLCRLICPPGGTILDPFAGSGSTGKAALLEGFRFVGIEQEPEYLAIAAARVRAAHEQQKQIELLADLPAPAPFIPRQAPSAHQVQLFEAA